MCDLKAGEVVRNIRKGSRLNGMKGIVQWTNEVVICVDFGRQNSKAAGYDLSKLTYLKKTWKNNLERVFDNQANLRPERKMIKRERVNVITGKSMSSMIQDLGGPEGVIQFNERALGKSTGQAFAIISQAMLNPGMVISTRGVDHAYSKGKHVDSHFYTTLVGLIGNNKLKGFDLLDGAIVYNPIVTVETYVERH